MSTVYEQEQLLPYNHRIVFNIVYRNRFYHGGISAMYIFLYIFFWVGLVILAVASLYVHSAMKEAATFEIKRYIRRSGGSEISFSRITSANSIILDVTYKDRHGRNQHTNVMMNKLRFSLGKLHWTTDPATVLNPPRPGKSDFTNSLAVDSQRHSETPSEQLSSKEQIIADLTADNKRLQEKVAALEKQLKSYA